jgi:hypothetical protein
MIDAYTIGITLALDNGVSEGLATIRRDLIALNGVVDGSATRLTHLTRAAADLQFHPGIVERISKGQTPPARGGGDKTLTLPTDWSQLNAGIFGLSPPDLHLPTGNVTRASAIAAIQPNTDTGSTPIGRSGMISSDARSGAPDILSSVPDTIRDWRQGAPISDLTENGSPMQTLPRVFTPTAPWEGSGSRGPMSPGAEQSQILEARADLPLSPSNDRNNSASVAADHLSLHPWQQGDAGSKGDSFKNSHGTAYRTTAWARPPDLGSMMSSAVSPATEPQSTALQGDIYVDGTRLGRWMTDRLVKAADLPRAATTGFDPRMTATWPGAPISA